MMIIGNGKERISIRDFNFADVTDTVEFEFMVNCEDFKMEFLKDHYDHSGNYHRSYEIVDKHPEKRPVKDTVFDITEEDYIEGVDD